MQEFYQAASKAEQDDMMMALNELQVKDTQRLFNGLTERCFIKCVNDFRSISLDGKEKKCVHTCFDKYINSLKRVGLRYAEETQLQGPGMKPS